MLSLFKNLIFRVIQTWFGFFTVGGAADVPQGPVLVFAPHPDDETIGCGAAIARFCAEGRKVRVVIVTDGRGSTKSALLTPDDLAAVRRAEVLNATAKLGLAAENVFFLNYPDGEMARHAEALVKDVASHIEGFAPVLVFGTFSYDEHADHRALAAAVGRVQDAGQQDFRVFEYPGWHKMTCWNYGVLRCLVRVSLYKRCRQICAGNFLAKKEAAMLQHRSQFENLTGEEGWHYFPASSRKRFCAPYELFFEREKRQGCSNKRKT